MKKKKSKKDRKKKLLNTKKSGEKTYFEWMFGPWMEKPNQYRDIPNLHEEDETYRNIGLNCAGDLNSACSTALVSAPISLSLLKS